jgi:hypothetical protein
MLLAVRPALAAPARRGQQSLGDVVADRAGRHPGALGELGDSDGLVSLIAHGSTSILAFPSMTA